MEENLASTLSPLKIATAAAEVDNDGPVMYQSKPAEVVLIVIVASVVFLVVVAYHTIELTLVSDKVFITDHQLQQERHSESSVTIN